ncbi:MAG TPA: DUF6491 family protein [Caulobacteraceae bacterium]
MRAFAVISLLAVASLVSGAASPAAAQGSAAAPRRDNACFYARNVESFAAADDTTVNLRVSSRQIYQLKLFGPCVDLDFSQRIGLRSRGISSFVCEGQANDLELFARSPAGPTRCPVTSVRRLSADEVAALPKRARP